MPPKDNAVSDEALLQPVARYEHVNRLGKDTFLSQAAVQPNGLRSLPKPLEAAPIGTGLA